MKHAILTAGGWTALAAALVAVACGGGGKSQTPVLRAWTETDPRIGREAVVLRCDCAHPLEARIAPSAGSNLFSLKYDGQELLYIADSLSRFDGSAFGVPVLYPTPCRIPGGRFTFRGEQFDFGLNSGGTFIHGLVRDAAWKYNPPVVGEGNVSLVTWIDFAPGSPLYEKFPFDHRLTLTWTLDPGGLKISFGVNNRDARDLPFGLGFHPYWSYVAGREDVWLSAPVGERMELAGLVPTGKLLPVEGTPFDIRGPVEVAKLKMDDVFTGMQRDRPTVIEFRRGKIGLTLAAAKRFGHLIVYDQPENPFFCVENLTCSPDAHNLYARGFEAESGLIVVPPNSEIHGWIKYSLEKME